MEPFIGQIMMFGGNFAPRSWAMCDGQLLPISQNSALFSLLGTIYGGDGQTTFALPDLRGRFPMHWGNGPGLTPRNQGLKTGTEGHNLSTSQLPAHNHQAAAVSGVGNQSSPGSHYPATANDGENNYSSGTPDTFMGGTSSVGQGNSVNHMPPFLTVTFVIALQGIYPSRS